MGDLGVPACPRRGHSTAGGGWHWHWHRSRTDQRGHCWPWLSPRMSWGGSALPSLLAVSQMFFEDRRSGRPRSIAWVPDWDRLSLTGARQVLRWGVLVAPSHHPQPSLLSLPHSTLPQVLLPHLPSPLPFHLPFMPSASQRSVLPGHHGGLVPMGGMEERHPMYSPQAHLDTAVT